MDFQRPYSDLLVFVLQESSDRSADRLIVEYPLREDQPEKIACGVSPYVGAVALEPAYRGLDLIAYRERWGASGLNVRGVQV